VAKAVVFDFYGTLARWRDRHDGNYAEVLARHGYVLPDEVTAAYIARYDGIAHAEHSTDAETYEAWVRGRLCDLTTECHVSDEDRDLIIDALRASDRDPMMPYPEAEPTLRALRSEGWRIGVCSNWGWELNTSLEGVGLLDLVDSAVTSARAGSRKPHPQVYAHSAASLGVDVTDIVFVGDSWRPDVEGPLELGMTAVHVWRESERVGQRPPELLEGAHRIGDLSELLPLIILS
jgi:putative hydrolase of the HAD superfamily